MSAPKVAEYGNRTPETPTDHARFLRSKAVLGQPGMRRLAEARIVIFGLGGVGSWCAESLVRTGLRHLTLVDSDRVCITNINRQLQATDTTVGAVKADALKQRLLDINPQAEIEAVQDLYDVSTQAAFDLDAWDVVIDAIDSLQAKALLLYNASCSRTAVFASMGAAGKIDPTRIRVREFLDIQGCPLASRVRRHMRKTGQLPKKPIPSVFSDEPMRRAPVDATCGTAACLCPRAEAGPGRPELLNHEWCSRKAVINGSLAHITGIFGLTLAGLAIQHLCETDQDEPA